MLDLRDERFFADRQDSIEFFEFPGNAGAGLVFFTHIVVPNKVAVCAQDDALLHFFLDSVEAIPLINCLTNGKHFVL